MVVEEMWVWDGLVDLRERGERTRRHRRCAPALRHGDVSCSIPGTDTSPRYGEITDDDNPWTSEKKFPQGDKRELRVQNGHYDVETCRIYEKRSPNFPEVGENRRVASMKNRANRVSTTLLNLVAVLFTSITIDSGVCGETQTVSALYRPRQAEFEVNSTLFTPSALQRPVQINLALKT